MCSLEDLNIQQLSRYILAQLRCHQPITEDEKDISLFISKRNGVYLQLHNEILKELPKNRVSYFF